MRERKGDEVSTQPVSISRVGQNRIYTLYMTSCTVISLQQIPCVNCMYTVYTYKYMALAHPIYKQGSVPVVVLFVLAARSLFYYACCAGVGEGRLMAGSVLSECGA